MSKRKILDAWKTAVVELSGVPVPAETVKNLERPFTEMRQLHSQAEQRRQEAEDLVRKQGETITTLRADAARLAGCGNLWATLEWA